MKGKKPATNSHQEKKKHHFNFQLTIALKKVGQEAKLHFTTDFSNDGNF
jgi:hypothetical protein